MCVCWTYSIIFQKKNNLRHIWQSRKGWRLITDSPKVNLGFGGEGATYLENYSLFFPSSWRTAFLNHFAVSLTKEHTATPSFWCGFTNLQVDMEFFYLHSKRMSSSAGPISPGGRAPFGNLRLQYCSLRWQCGRVGRTKDEVREALTRDGGS